MRKQWVILLGMVLFVAYFLPVAASSSMPLLIGTQVARGVALSVVGALGILAGATAQAVGYRAALLATPTWNPRPARPWAGAAPMVAESFRRSSLAPG